MLCLNPSLLLASMALYSHRNYLSFKLHSNFSVTHLLKLAGLHAFFSYSPITCVRTKAYLVQQGQSYVQVLGEEGPEDSNGSIGRLIFQLLLLLLLPLSITVESL